MSEQDLARVIAAAVKAALAAEGAGTGTPEKPKTRKGKRASGALVLERKGAKFTFTLVAAGIRGGTQDKYRVRVERGALSHERGWKIPAGTSVQEYATAKRLDLIAGLTAKYFA